MEEVVAEACEAQLCAIKELLCEKRGQFLLVGPDEAVLDLLVQAIQKTARYSSVLVKSTRHLAPEHKIFFLKLANKAAIDYQSLLYYYLELPLQHDCFVCLVSTSSLCLNSLEKRVKSRFKNQIYFVPYVSLADAECDDSSVELNVSESSDKEDGLCQTLCAQRQERLRETYDLEKFSLSYLLDLLGPVHFALIAMANRQKIALRNAAELYRKFALHVNEIKGVSSETVAHCYCDLVEAAVIGKSGELLVDFGECCDYVAAKCPRYLRDMCAKNR
ncbi:hypothetical protein PAPHI01_1187 [Pancytospora philotis]|nr:hypothetical protein PAPHI01_1187 [Pancytospora philotis]